MQKTYVVMIVNISSTLKNNLTQLNFSNSAKNSEVYLKTTDKFYHNPNIGENFAS